MSDTSVVVVAVRVTTPDHAHDSVAASELYVKLVAGRALPPVTAPAALTAASLPYSCTAVRNERPCAVVGPCQPPPPAGRVGLA